MITAAKPREVIQAHIVLEPLLTSKAALHAAADKIEGKRKNPARTRSATTWRESEPLSGAGCERDPTIPGKVTTAFPSMTSFWMPLKTRDANLSESGMGRHLQSVSSGLFPHG